jgi:hypothetical protein
MNLTGVCYRIVREDRQKIVSNDASKVLGIAFVIEKWITL